MVVEGDDFDLGAAEIEADAHKRDGAVGLRAAGFQAGQVPALPVAGLLPNVRSRYPRMAAIVSGDCHTRNTSPSIATPSLDSASTCRRRSARLVRRKLSGGIDASDSARAWARARSDSAGTTSSTSDAASASLRRHRPAKVRERLHAAAAGREPQHLQRDGGEGHADAQLGDADAPLAVGHHPQVAAPGEQRPASDGVAVDRRHHGAGIGEQLVNRLAERGQESGYVACAIVHDPEEVDAG